MSDSPSLLVLFGATGLTGKPLLKKALEKGLRVRVLVRDAGKLPEDIKSNANVEVVQGDLTDLDAVKKCLEGAKYVISVAGSNTLSKDRFMLKMATAIVETMPGSGVERFFYQAGAFTPKPGQKQPVMMKVLRGIFGPLGGMKQILLDNDAVVNYLADKKEVKWVVGMPGRIQDWETKGVLKVGEKAGVTVGNVDLAAFNLECVMGGEFDGQCVYPNY